MAQQWVIQEKLTDEEMEWDTWVIGIIEEGMFLEQMQTHDKKMAIRVKCVMEWFEMFEEGILIPADKINEKTAILQQPKKRRTKA